MIALKEIHGFLKQGSLDFLRSLSRRVSEDAVVFASLQHLNQANYTSPASLNGLFSRIRLGLNMDRSKLGGIPRINSER